MSRYRDRLQIIADILAIVNRRARKTQIMYQANLSYKLLCRYLDEVSDAGLICLEEDFYVLTSRGRRFLARHNMYSKRCKILEQRLLNANQERSLVEGLCTNKDKKKENPTQAA